MLNIWYSVTGRVSRMVGVDDDGVEVAPFAIERMFPSGSYAKYSRYGAKRLRSLMHR